MGVFLIFFSISLPFLVTFRFLVEAGKVRFRLSLQQTCPRRAFIRQLLLLLRKL